MADKQHSHTIGLPARRLDGIVLAREQFVGLALALVAAVAVAAVAAVVEADVVVGAAGIELLAVAAQLEMRYVRRR